MNRRAFLMSATAAAATLADRAAGARRAQSLAEEGWRLFELTTHVHVQNASGVTRAWLPTPLVGTPYQQTLGDTYHADGGTSVMVENEELDLLLTEWPSGAEPILTVTSRVATHDRVVDLSSPHVPPPPDLSRFARYLAPTRLLPLDGIVRMTAEHVTRNAKTDVDKARAIYDWIVDNTFRDPTVRGCGIGDIKGMLETKNLGGKCADLNALYVGLAHASGLAARDVYGVRAAKSGLGYKSLGLSTDQASKAQHCRAEVFLSGFGWVPVDPADVRKVVLEEPPGHLAMDSEPVQRARQRLFGSWEMNWIAYNFEHDVALPGRSGKPLPFLMYPQGETAAGILDSLDPDTFKYSITAKEIASAS